MQASTEQLYQEAIRPLPLAEQFALVSRVVTALGDLTGEAKLKSWAQLNVRRGELIQQSVFGSLNETEQTELDALQRQADQIQELLAPRQTAEWESLERQIESMEPDE